MVLARARSICAWVSAVYEREWVQAGRITSNTFTLVALVLLALIAYRLERIRRAVDGISTWGIEHELSSIDSSISAVNLGR